MISTIQYMWQLHPFWFLWCFGTALAIMFIFGGLIVDVITSMLLVIGVAVSAVVFGIFWVAAKVVEQAEKFITRGEEK